MQVLLKVRFAEINRTALRDWATRLRVLNPHEISDNGNWSGYHRSIRRGRRSAFLLDSGNEEIQALVQAAVGRGDLRTLAEPNLLTLPGKEAYFLAGGEFPYPSIQGTGDATRSRSSSRSSGSGCGSPRTSPETARSGSRSSPK